MTILALVLVGHAQCLAHIGEGRQHDVDGQGIEGHQGGHQCNEFGARENPREMIGHEMNLRKTAEEAGRRNMARTMIPEPAFARLDRRKRWFLPIVTYGSLQREIGYAALVDRNVERG